MVKSQKLVGNRLFLAFFIFVLSAFIVYGAVTTYNPDGLLIVLEEYNVTNSSGDVIGVNYSIPEFESDEEIIIPLLMNISGPLNSLISLDASIGLDSSSKLLTELLDNQSISYITSDDSYTLSNSTSTASFSFSTRNQKQLFYLRMNTAEDEINDIFLNVIGTSLDPLLFPSLDFGDDGTIEWMYLGNFLGYVPNYTLPDNLDENSGNQGAAIIMDDPYNEQIKLRQYYCGSVNLPHAKDFEVYANMKSVDSGSDMTATMLKLDPSTTDSAYGIFSECKFNLPTGADFAYHSCQLDLDYPVSGDFLICVFNDVDGDGTTMHAQLKLETDTPSSSYICTDKTIRYDCPAHSTADFFIKVKPGNYSGALQGIETLDDNLLTLKDAFIVGLNNIVNDCRPLDSGSAGCAIPVALSSSSSGSADVSSFNMLYTSDSILYSSQDFYLILNLEPGALTDIDNYDLLNIQDSVLIDFDTQGFDLFAPSVNSNTTEEFNISFDSGASNSTEVLIYTLEDSNNNTNNFTYNLTTATNLINEHITFLNDKKSSYSDELEFLDIDVKITNAISQFNLYISRITSLSLVNGTDEQINENITNYTEFILPSIDNLLLDLPRSIIVDTEYVGEVIIEPSDVTSDSVIGSDDDRMQVYYHQLDFTIDVSAKHIKIELFDGTNIDGTIIEKSVSGMGTDYSIFEIIPSDIIINSENISFEDSFSFIDGETDFIFKKDYSSISGLEFTYFVQGNYANFVQNFKTLMVPKKGISSGIGDLVPECGDGICTVMELSDGTLVNLEDELSCPEDCSAKIDWGSIMLVMFIGLIIIAGVSLFFKLNPNKKQQPKKINVSSEKHRITLFSNPKDETSLKTYVGKALKSGMKKENIVETLLKRGWNKEQIDYIFSSLNRRR